MSRACEPRHDMTISSKPLGHLRRPDDVVAQVEWEKGTIKSLTLAMAVEVVARTSLCGTAPDRPIGPKPQV